MHTCGGHTSDVCRRNGGRQMARGAWLAMGFVLLAWSARGMAIPDQGNPGKLFIQIEGERLTVRAREIPHRQILQGLARQLNFELILTGPFDQPRSVEIEGRPWEQALKTALAPASWAFKYKSTAGQHRLIQVVVVAKEAEAPNTRRTRHTEAPPHSPATAIEQPQDAGQQVETEVEGHPEAVEAALHAPDPEVRFTAIAQLGQQADYEAVSVLLKVVHDANPGVQQRAMAALEVLVQRAEDLEIQQLAADALGIVLNPIAAEAISETLTEDRGE
jgi:HEAT repeats